MLDKQKYICRICNTTGNDQIYIAEEMMFGTKERFTYFMCRNCECLQITDIPKNLNKYYPRDYYSFNKKPRIRKESNNKTLKKLLIKLIVRNALFGRGYKLSRFARELIGFPEALRQIGPWLQKCKINNFNAKFLDVGCGSSSWWLESLFTIGFKNLLGVDPFIDSDKIYKNYCILKKDINDLENNDKYDLISFHHSFEHIPEQAKTLSKAYDLLKATGHCLIRIPTVSSLVWEEYKTDWVELDAPRHLYLHSKKSINYLAEKNGFTVKAIIPDSTEFEFIGSEQYKRGIPLLSEKSFYISPGNSNFTYREIFHLKEKSKKANLKNKAGRICIILEKFS